MDRRIFETLDSTMDEAARQRAQISGPTWLLALAQTAPRGRRGREWGQPDGNFSATLIFPTGDDAARRALRSFVAALALWDALGLAMGRDAGLELKWPNDVLLNGGKVAGILLESDADTLAIGFGVNLLAVPPRASLEPAAMPAVSLIGETGLRVAPEQFLSTLATRYALREEQFDTLGFTPIRTAWLARAARLGQKVSARLAGATHEGIFETIDAEGMLVLSTPQGRHRIAAGDVFF